MTNNVINWEELHGDELWVQAGNQSPPPPQKGWNALLLEESSANITSSKPRSRLSWKGWRLCQPRALFPPSVPPPIPASVPSLISSNSVSILEIQHPEKRKKVLSFLVTPRKSYICRFQDPRGVTNVTRQAWRKVPRGWKRGKLFWEIQLYFPSGEGWRKEGCRGKAGLIRILPHAGAGSIFGGKNKKAEAPGLSLFPELFKPITKALKDTTRMGIHYNRAPHLDKKMGVTSSPSPLLLLSEFLLRTLRIQNQKPSFIYQRGAGSPGFWVRLLAYT